MRRVLDAEVKATTLRLQVQRMGQNRPTRLDFCRDRDQRSPAARRAARVAYEPRLRRALERNFPGWTVVRLTTSMDLEHSFGPAYLRGWLRQGQRALAVVGRERSGDAIDHRWRADLRNSLAGGVPAWPSRNGAWWKGWR